MDRADCDDGCSDDDRIEFGSAGYRMWLCRLRARLGVLGTYGISLGWRY